MGVEHLDIILCHDIEFVEMQQIVDETIPAIQKIRDQGKVRYIGFSGYPMKVFPFIIDQIDVDVVLSYNHYHLQNTKFASLFPYLKEKGVGIMNAGPFCARLLTNAPLPEWHKEPEEVRVACKRPPHFAGNAASTLRSWPSSFAWPIRTSPQQLQAAPTRKRPQLGQVEQRHRWTRNFSGTSSLCLNNQGHWPH